MAPFRGFRALAGSLQAARAVWTGTKLVVGVCVSVNRVVQSAQERLSYLSPHSYVASPDILPGHDGEGHVLHSAAHRRRIRDQPRRLRRLGRPALLNGGKCHEGIGGPGLSAQRTMIEKAGSNAEGLGNGRAAPQRYTPAATAFSASSRCSASKPTGFVRCSSKPTARARRRSSS